MERGDQEKGEKREYKERKGGKKGRREREGKKEREAGLSLHMAILYYMILKEFSCI